MARTKLVEQIRTEYHAIWLRDRSRWDECKIALDLLNIAEQLIENMASEGEPDET